MHLEEIPYPVITAVGVAGAGLGLWRGGPDGRIVASIILFELLMGWLFENNQALSIAQDLAGTTITLTLVLRGRNYWTIWAAATQVLSVATQGLRLIPTISPWSYYSAQITWFLVLIATVAVGALLPRRRPAAASTT